MEEPFIGHGSNQAKVSDVEEVKAVLSEYEDAISGEFALYTDGEPVVQFWSFNDIFDVYDRENEEGLNVEFLNALRQYLDEPLFIQNIAIEWTLRLDWWVVTEHRVERQEVTEWQGTVERTNYTT